MLSYQKTFSFQWGLITFAMPEMMNEAIANMNEGQI